MGSFFVWVSAERTILRAFRDPEVTLELYLASECSSQHLFCKRDRKRAPCRELRVLVKLGLKRV